MEEHLRFTCTLAHMYDVQSRPAAELSSNQPSEALSRCRMPGERHTSSSLAPVELSRPPLPQLPGTLTHCDWSAGAGATSRCVIESAAGISSVLVP